MHMHAMRGAPWKDMRTFFVWRRTLREANQHFYVEKDKGTCSPRWTCMQLFAAHAGERVCAPELQEWRSPRPELQHVFAADTFFLPADPA